MSELNNDNDFKNKFKVLSDNEFDDQLKKQVKDLQVLFSKNKKGKKDKNDKEDMER